MQQRYNIKRKLIKLNFLIKPTIIVGLFFFLILFFIRIFSPLIIWLNYNHFDLKFVKHLLFNTEPAIKKYQNKTNIIILGVAGGQHDGPDLTDSILSLSISFSNNNVAFISIPRDIYLPSLKDKVNTSYHYGEQKQKGGGLILAKASVEEIIGQPIQYALIIDFSGFKQLVDAVGGINIYVEKEFIDREYPIPGKENDSCNGDSEYRCRYEVVTFNQGWQDMDGERTLKYVRSRHAEGEEGTDFARGKRQQQVIIALKNKIQSQAIWKNPKKLYELWLIINKIIKSDMVWADKITIFNTLLKFQNEKIRHITIDTGDEKKLKKGFLINPPLWQYNGLWVLVPRSGNFKEIHDFIACQIDNINCSMGP